MVHVKSILTGHSAPIYGVSWDGEFLYTSAGDKYVTRWDLDTENQDSSFTVKLDSTAFVINAALNHCYIGCSDGTLLAVDTKMKKIAWQINHFGNSWFSIEIIEESNWLIAGDEEGNILVVDLETGQRIIHLPLAAGKIRSIRYINNSLFVCTQLIGVLQFSIDTWNEISAWEPNEKGTMNIQFDSKNNHYITTGKDAHIVVSDSNFNCIKRIPAHYQNIYQVIPFENEWITCSMDKTIKIWDSDFTKVTQKLDVKAGAHNRSVNNLALINSRMFASVSDDKKIIIWERTN